MKSTSFQALVVGALCLCTAGLAAVAVNQNRQLQTLLAKPQQEVAASEYQSRWRELNDKQIATEATLTELRSAFSTAASTQTGQAHRIEQVASDLERLKGAPQAQLSDAALQPLELRLSAIEEQLAKVRLQGAPQPQVKSAGTDHKTKPLHSPRHETPTPPFSVMGSDLRGPERFLSLQPLGEQSLRSVRLLQPGETFGGWRLDHLNTSTAVFSNSGQTTHNFAIPEEAR